MAKEPEEVIDQVAANLVVFALACMMLAIGAWAASRALRMSLDELEELYEEEEDDG